MTTHGSLANIEKLQSDLWEAADNLRANSKLTSSKYCMPVLGIIFLRHAANRFEAPTLQIVADQNSGKRPKRKMITADYVKRRALFLPKEFGIFERNFLEDLMRTFNREALRSATGDVFGRIYEYFLIKFAMQGAQDNGEFFIPPPLVQTLVNIIEANTSQVMKEGSKMPRAYWKQMIQYAILLPPDGLLADFTETSPTKTKNSAPPATSCSRS